jgi:hypothetical protein
MPNAWEFILPHFRMRLEHLKNEDGSFQDKYRAHFPSDQLCPSLFLDHEEYGSLIVDSAGRKWVENCAIEWIVFREVELVDDED